METLEELREKVRKAKAAHKIEEEREKLNKELFELNHKKGLETFRNVKGNLKHLGNKAVKLVKDSNKKKPKKKKEKKKKPYDPFANVNFNAFS